MEPGTGQPVYDGNFAARRLCYRGVHEVPAADSFFPWPDLRRYRRREQHRSRCRRSIGRCTRLGR
ncbi:MAG TPA: hypothetical protein DEQ55_01675, partial [Pseudomonas sp.]|nr:hypothetical protein [Pseudomonas sp.]